MESIKYFDWIVDRVSLIDEPNLAKLRSEECFMCSSDIGELCYQIGIVNVANGECFAASFCELCSENLKFAFKKVLKFEKIIFDEFLDLSKDIKYYSNEETENEQ